MIIMAMDFRATFKAATEAMEAGTRAGSINKADHPEDMLEFYGLFKVATVGGVNTERPGLFSFAGRAKWDAWKAREGMSRVAAMATYIEKADSHPGVPFRKP